MKGSQQDDSNADKEYNHADISDAKLNEVDESLPTSILNNQGTDLSEGADDKSMSTPVTDEVHTSFTLPVFGGAQTRVRLRGFLGNRALFLYLKFFLTCIGHAIHRDLVHIPWDRGKCHPSGLIYRMGLCYELLFLTYCVVA